MTIVKKRKPSNKTATPINVTFSIQLAEDERVQFNPNKAFNHITTAQVLKIIQKANIETTNENASGYVNFKLFSDDKTFGFLNYWANDLTDESSDEERTDAVTLLSHELSEITVDAIRAPISEDEADSAIDNL